MAGKRTGLGIDALQAYHNALQQTNYFRTQRLGFDRLETNSHGE